VATGNVGKIGYAVDVTARYLGCRFPLRTTTGVRSGTYMLCEINASSVFPYPVNAASAMARAAVRALMSAKAQRRQE